jgi:hypothetical protein
MIRTLLLLSIASLCGCQGLVDVLNALPPPTPQEQCEASGGKWHDITTYDQAGNATQSGECISP